MTNKQAREAIDWENLIGFEIGLGDVKKVYETLEKFLKQYTEQKILEARVDELKKLISLHSRTYKQTITDHLGGVYLSDSHGYISKYETQERIAELKAQLAKITKGEK